VLKNDLNKLEQIDPKAALANDNGASGTELPQSGLEALRPMDALVRKVAFIEARLTLLEHSFAKRLQATTDYAALLPQGHIIKIACDEPGLFISQCYPSEHDASKTKFCWIGSPGLLQFIFPVPAKQAMTCSLKLAPHRNVDFQKMRIFANDDEITHTVQHDKKTMNIHFNLAANTALHVSLIISNVSSVRPSALGENSDVRLLAARFYGAEFSML
jgi:hypothetical protein